MEQTKNIGEQPIKQTQQEKVLNALEEAKGDWVSGTYFLRELFLSQFHARIFELQKKGYKIVSSEDNDMYGFKSYKLIEEK